MNFEFLLYDVTSTYFEREAERNPQARRGTQIKSLDAGFLSSKSSRRQGKWMRLYHALKSALICVICGFNYRF